MNEGLSLAWSRVTVERQYSASLAAHGATAIVLAQEAFADAQTLGGYFDEFVIVARGGRPTYEPEPPKTAEELIERIAQGGGV